jgi:hypothetical protein
MIWSGLVFHMSTFDCGWMTLSAFTALSIIFTKWFVRLSDKISTKIKNI